MIINVLTLFPEMFTPVTELSIIGRAIENHIIDIRLTNIRDYSLDKHNRVDDTPFGGGAGMVMAVDPVFRSLEAISAKNKRIIYMSPKGKQLDQKLIEELSLEEELVLLCGHYEGIDQRIIDYWEMEEISIGDYILTGGELPAMILIDAVARLIPKVLGSNESHDEESIYSGLLEYPHYTKPREYRGLNVPEVLVSGNHKLIHLWRFTQSLKITKERRPDLFQNFLQKISKLTKDEIKVLEQICKGEQY
ncbi:MAG: tRNA (guanosine(37)-N1)-methyltransferase TrmD [Anaerovoracaceae bacterium]|jgi:tRNA (guanine37-N1)-methyltransferase